MGKESFSLRKRNGQIMWNIKVYRLLVLLTTRFGFEYILGAVKATNMKASTQKAYRRNLSHTWIKAISKRDKDINVKLIIPGS